MPADKVRLSLCDDDRTSGPSSEPGFETLDRLGSVCPEEKVIVLCGETR